MPIKTVTPPTAEPITLEEAKEHLRVVLPDEDALIGRLITAARRMLENRTNRRLMPQTVEFAVAGFGAGIFVPSAPFRALASITYTDPGGVDMVLPPTDYFVDDYIEPAAVVAAFGASWPAIRDGSLILVRAEVGYASAEDVPDDLKAWMLLAIGTMYDHRATVATGTSLAELPPDFMSMLWHPYMVYL